MPAFIPDLPVILAFALAAFVLAVTPGPDMALFVSRTMNWGRRHGYATVLGAITGIGNCLPDEVLHYLKLCERAVVGDEAAWRYAKELEQALLVLSTFDEGPDLVLYYKYLLVLLGDSDFELHFNETDQLSDSQRHYAEEQLKIFKNWWANWGGKR